MEFPTKFLLKYLIKPVGAGSPIKFVTHKQSGLTRPHRKPQTAITINPWSCG